MAAAAGDEDVSSGETPGAEESWEDKATPNMAAIAAEDGAVEGAEAEIEGPGLSADGRRQYSRDYMKKVASSEGSMLKLPLENLGEENFHILVYAAPAPRP